jgi:hypothetical protein
MHEAPLNAGCRQAIRRSDHRLGGSRGWSHLWALQRSSWRHGLQLVRHVERVLDTDLRVVYTTAATF